MRYKFLFYIVVEEYKLYTKHKSHQRVRGPVVRISGVGENLFLYADDNFSLP